MVRLLAFTRCNQVAVLTLYYLNTITEDAPNDDFAFQGNPVGVLSWIRLRSV